MSIATAIINWNPFKSSNTPVLSEYPTPEERQAYVTYKIEQVFKNNFSNHTQVKTEVTDHFIEAIESSPNQLTKAEFLAKYEELYNSFGKGSGIRKMVYDRVKIKQVEESKIAIRFRNIDNIVMPGIIGASSVTILDGSSGIGKYLVYISFITLSILLLHATYKLTSLNFQRYSNNNDNKHKGVIAKNLQWVAISLFATAFYFTLDETILSSRFFAFVLFGVSYFTWRRYTIDHIRHSELSSKLRPTG